MKSKLNVLIAAAVWTGLGASDAALATSDDTPREISESEALPLLAKRKGRPAKTDEAAKPGKAKAKKPMGPAAKGKSPKAGPAKAEKAKGKDKADKGKGKDKDKADKGKGKDKDKERGKSEGKGKGKKLGHLDTADKEAAHHARRLAKIARIEQLAKEKGNDELLAKVQKMRERETSRHEKSLARIERKASAKDELEDKAEAKAAKTKAKNAKKAKKNAKGKGKGKKGGKK